MGLAEPRDADGAGRHVARPLRRGDDDRTRAIGDETAVSGAQRLDHPGRLQIRLQRQGSPLLGVGGERRVATERHGDLAEVLRARAVQHHMAPGREGMQADGAEEAEPSVLAAAVAPRADGHRWGITEHADAHLAEAGLDGHRCALDHRHRTGPAHHLGGRVAGIQAEHRAEPQEVGRDAVDDRLRVAGLGDQPIDVSRRHAHIRHRGTHRLGLQRPRRAAEPGPERRVSHADDPGAAHPYCPTKRGGRRSRKAATPSRWSAVCHSSDCACASSSSS